jgi:hypothetical protein
MPLSRIECCAFLKSLIGAKVPSTSWDDAVKKCAEIMDTHATAAPQPAAAPPAPPSPGAGVSAVATLQVVSMEDQGKKCRVEATGYATGKYFSAWDKHAAAARQLTPGATFTATVVEKPNPKGGRPYLNLEDIRITGVATLADVPEVADMDIPF